MGFWSWALRSVLTVRGNKLIFRFFLFFFLSISARFLHEKVFEVLQTFSLDLWLRERLREHTGFSRFFFVSVVIVPRVLPMLGKFSVTESQCQPCFQVFKFSPFSFLYLSKWKEARHEVCVHVSICLREREKERNRERSMLTYYWLYFFMTSYISILLVSFF